MSGIAGILSSQKQDLAEKMIEKISHRGTSKPRLWKNSMASIGAVGFSRLHQRPGPLSTPSGDRVIVIDGRLTNRTALKKLLKSHAIDRGYSGEVALHAYEELNVNSFGRLEGDFALAIVDKGRMVLARDRLGVRPLYYGFHEDALCFASEIKALVDWVDEVHEFPPGYFMLSDLGMFPYQSYLPEDVDLDGPQDTAEHLAVYLQSAVQRAIPEGVEVGVWLSGGIDSSVIAALARHLVKNLHTFSAGTEGAPDLEYARQVADYIQSEHHEIICGRDEMKAVLEKTIFQLESFDGPLVRSSVVNFLVAQLASDYVPFVLSGEGGDELFAGYTYQKECGGEVELTLSIQDAIAALHNTALQRVDRSAAAHGTGVGTPFLDPSVVRYALAIPARWKIRGSKSVEKWPLRQGLSDALPDEVIWRKKVKFWKGAGASSILPQFAEEEISDQEFEAEKDVNAEFQLRSQEELLYYRIFKNHFGGKVPLNEVGRTQHI